MHHRLKRAVVISMTAVLPLVLGTSRAFSQAGQSGLAFLKLGVSGRGISMGDAMTASVNGAASTYYNPSGLLVPADSGSSAQLLLMHKEWIQDTRTEFLGASVILGSNDAFGFSLNSTTTSDIEIRTHPGTPDGTFTARNYSIGLSFAHQVSEDVGLGVTGKFLYQKILVDEADGYGVDIGGQYRTPVEHLTVGAVVSNIGRMGALETDRITLPATVRIGGAYGLGLMDSSAQLTLAADGLRNLPEHRSYLDVGAECVFSKIVAARAGYQFGSQGRGFSAGVGIQYGILAFDYAYAPLSYDLGDTHTFSLGLNF